MDVEYGPPNLVEVMNMDHQVDRAAPAGLALDASAGESNNRPDSFCVCFYASL